MTMTPPDFLMRVPPLKLHVRNATQTDSEPPMVRAGLRFRRGSGGH
jgi:hypothetical protein